VIDEGCASLQVRRREDGGAVVVRVRCCGCRCANGDRDDGGAAEKMERHGGGRRGEN